MNITLVHLCDLHIKADSRIDEKKAESIGNIVSHSSNGSDKVVFIVTGDIAFSGQEIEYEKAKLFFEKIQAFVVGKECVFAFSAGNHDCNYDECTSSRRKLIEAVVNGESPDDSYVDSIARTLKNFWKFQIEMQNTSLIAKKLCSEYTIEGVGGNIYINAVNSSWMSHRGTKPGETVIPEDVLKMLWHDKGFTILAIHHTSNWFIPEIQRKIRKAYSGYDFVFTGHEHEQDLYMVERENEKKTVMVEGGELSPFVNHNQSEFNVVVIDTIKSKFKQTKYTYSKKKSLYESGQPSNWKEFKHSSRRQTGAFAINANFNKELTDPGAPYAHSTLKKVSLDDIFIYPDVREMDKEKKLKDSRSSNIINLKKLLSGKKHTRYYFMGSERSGKSTLGKRLFTDCYDADMFPVLVRGECISTFAFDDFEKSIEAALKVQYSEFVYTDFIQQDRVKKVIIIDDFHKSGISISEKARLLHSVSNQYDNVFVFVDEFMQFGELLANTPIGEEFNMRFATYTILPFGFKRRHELVNRWYQTSGISVDNDVLKKIDSAEEMLNTVVCKNFVPSYPFYLYTAVSAYDGANKETLAESSYAAYYDMLLKSALAKIDKRPEELNLRISYLAEFAYRIYQNKSACISENEFEIFHNYYRAHYAVRIDFDPFISKLVKASVLGTQDNMYFFRYKYFYFYFLAKYLADNIRKEDVNNVIIDLCITLHMETSSNVLMFLTHLSKDPVILQCLIEQADSIFQNNVPIHLDDDVAIVNSLIGSLPHLAIENPNSMQFRSEEREYQDGIEGISDDGSKYSGKDIEVCPPKSESDITGPDRLLLNIGATYKAMDIIGMILKNQYGSLAATEKLSLCNQGYKLPLRALAEYFSFISTNKDALITELREIISKKRNKITSSSDIDLIAKQHIFTLSELISFAFIKRAAISLGSTNLNMTYASLLAQNSYNSVKLIDIAIKLGCSSHIPIDEIKGLVIEFKNNIVALSVLRNLVIYKIYMYDIPLDARQKVCGLLKISMSHSSLTRASARETGIDV